MKLIKSYIINNNDYKKARKYNPKGIMLHSVGCAQPTATVFVNNYNKPSCGVSVHAFIDANDGTIYQTMPFEYRCGHCGGQGNNEYIAVEMCEPSCIKYVGGSSFVATDLARAKQMVSVAYNSAVDFFAHICTTYGWNPLADGVIISHSEGAKRGIASSHADPEHLWNQLNMGYTMDGFRKAVAVKMGLSSVMPGTTPNKPTNTASGYSRIQFIKDVQSVTGSKVDGIAGSETIKNTITVSKIWNRKHAVVKYIQKYLNANGYNCGEVDGIFGSNTADAVKRYQKAHGCVADGVITKQNRTWKKLLGMI